MLIMIRKAFNTDNNGKSIFKIKEWQ